MNNIAQEKLQKLADETQQLISEINEGVNWSDDYLKNEYQDETAYALKKYRRKLKKVKSALTQKPVIALFGASQVGKSYLVKNVLNDENNNLKIPDHRNDKEYDFLADINPEGGGKESTSVVTRFTYESNPDTNKLPIKIKLLSPKDLITILVDSYFSDIKKRKSEITKEDIVEHLEQLPNYFSSETQNYLDEDNVYDIDDYLTELFFESNFRGRLQAFKDARYWHEVAASIHKIPYSNWAKVFEILWGKKDKFTEVFNILINELNNVSFSKLIYADFDAVLRENGTILDVRRLKELMSNQGEPLQVEDTEGNPHSIRRNTLCALTHEVIVNISKEAVEKHKFIDNIDILDFPGARSRLKLDESENLSNDEISEMLLRGKVAYLFNSYSINYEISNLFVCTRSKQTDVREVPELINNWISYNIGKNQEERSVVLQNAPKPPLFVIFTWWNDQMIFSKPNDTVEGEFVGTDKLNYKWEHRFESLIKEEVFGTFKWYKEWTNSGTFKNYYLLRDFEYSKDIFFGFDEENKELGLQENRAEYYQLLKESFTKSPLVRKFFPDPAYVWEQTSTVGNDGSQYIIENMAEVANNQNKTKRYLQIIQAARADVEKTLQEHYHSDDADAQIRKAARDGSDLQGIMNKVFGIDAYNFGSFIEHLTISESEIYNFYRNMLKDKVVVEKQSTNEYVLYRQASPRLSLKNKHEENLEILRQDYHRDTIEEVEEYFEEELGIDLTELFYGEKNNLKNKSLQLAEGARDHWFDSKLNADHFLRFVDLGFDKTLLDKLFDNLKTNFNKLHLENIVAENIRLYVDRYNKVDEAEDMIAHITAGIINEFIISVGWTYYPDVEKEKIQETDQINNLRLIFPEEVEVFEAPERESLSELFDIMERLNEELSRKPINLETIKNVPMIKNYSRWRELLKISFIANCDIPTYNVEANGKLGTIIDKIKMHNFSIA